MKKYLKLFLIQSFFLNLLCFSLLTKIANVELIIVGRPST